MTWDLVTLLGNRSDNERLLQHMLNHSWPLNSTLSDPGIQGKTLDNALLIVAYSVLSIIAIFGNSLVCYVILKNKRLHTATNFFLTNLAVSDLLVTCVNVPFNIMRHLLYSWPFGEFMCHLVNFSLMVSVYVSTYTLTAIALDRHRVLLKPLSRRMSKTLAVVLLVFIWILAVLLSLPFGIFINVKEMIFILENKGVGIMTTVRRCHQNYPANSHIPLYLSVATIVLQYCLPLTLIGVAYGRIVQRLWSRTHVGAVTANQQMSQARAKRKSIKLLITVVVVFALCWFPLNLYHLLTNFHPDTEMFRYNAKVFFTCHWVAISSTCYNPFVYCWLNESFREEIRSCFRWCRHFRLRLRGYEAQAELVKGPQRRRPEDSLGRSSMTSSARTTSVRREVTLTSDPDEMLQSCLKPLDDYLMERTRKKEDEKNMLAMHRNGRVEYHVTRLHNCQ